MSGVGTGVPGQALIERVQALRALAEARERDIRYLTELLAEGRQAELRCEDLDHEGADR